MIGAIDFSAAQQALQVMLEKIPGGYADCTDLNVSAGIAAVRRIGSGASDPIDVQISDDEIAALGMLMSSAMDLELSPRHPTLEKLLPPRFRVTLTHPVVTRTGHWNCSVRLLADRIRPLQRYIEDGEIEIDVAKRLVALATTRATMLISGATGSGKTTLLGSIVGEIPMSERLVVIEDAAELILDRPNVACLEAPASAAAHDAALISFEDLIAHAMRLDPDVIIVGEVRGREASRFMTIAAAGHPCMTTIHADDGELALVRLHEMVKLSEPNTSEVALRRAINAVCHVRFDRQLGRRRVSLWETRV